MILTYSFSTISRFFLKFILSLNVFLISGDNETNCRPELKKCVLKNYEIDRSNYSFTPSVIANITYFDIGGNNLVKFLPINIGQKFPNLEKLSVYKCSLRKVGNESLRGLSALKKLLLYKNSITDIEVGAFHDLRSLEELDLSKNNLKMLHESLLDHNLLLRSVLVANNQLMFVSSGLFDNKRNLTLADLQSNTCINGIFQFGSSLGNLTESLESNCSAGNLIKQISILQSQLPIQPTKDEVKERNDGIKKVINNIFDLFFWHVE